MTWGIRTCWEFAALAETDYLLADKLEQIASIFPDNPSFISAWEQGRAITIR
jgi:hypothetical protein